MRRLLLLRPEPGLSASAARARSLGLDVIGCPLFRVEPLTWTLPDPAIFDGLLFTSANALRHGGAELERLGSLPVYAVGQATAESALEAGFQVVAVGTTDAADLIRQVPQSHRLLHLTGEDRGELPEGHSIDQVAVYRSVEIDKPGLPGLDGFVAVVHSPRAARRLAELAPNRSRTAVAAISSAAAAAAGDGWELVDAAPEPTDASLLALAARLCHTSPPR